MYVMSFAITIGRFGYPATIAVLDGADGGYNPVFLLYWDIGWDLSPGFRDRDLWRDE